MTLADIRASVLSKLDDTYDNSIIDEAINWFQFQIYNDHRIRAMEETDTIQVANGATTADFPDDMQTLINLSTTSTSPVQGLMDLYVEYGDFIKQYPNFQSVLPSQVRQWTDFGNAMRFSAPINAATTIFAEYLRRPDLMTDDDDEAEAPDQYAQMYTLGATISIMNRNEDYDEAASEQAILAPLITSFVRNEGRGQIKIGPTIMRTNRRPTRRSL